MGSSLRYDSFKSRLLESFQPIFLVYLRNITQWLVLKGLFILNLLNRVLFLSDIILSCSHASRKLNLPSQELILCYKCIILFIINEQSIILILNRNDKLLANILFLLYDLIALLQINYYLPL